jgi:hypothetical protein
MTTACFYLSHLPGSDASDHGLNSTWCFRVLPVYSRKINAKVHFHVDSNPYPDVEFDVSQSPFALLAYFLLCEGVCGRLLN